MVAVVTIIRCVVITPIIGNNEQTKLMVMLMLMLRSADADGDAKVC